MDGWLFAESLFSVQIRCALIGVPPFRVHGASRMEGRESRKHDGPLGRAFPKGPGIHAGNNCLARVIARQAGSSPLAGGSPSAPHSPLPHSLEGQPSKWVVPTTPPTAVSIGKTSSDHSPQTLHRKVRKDRKDPSGFRYLGPCPRSVHSGRAPRGGGRRAASGPKWSGIPPISFLAVPLDIRSIFACLATLAVQMQCLCSLDTRPAPAKFLMRRASLGHHLLAEFPELLDR